MAYNDINVQNPFQNLIANPWDELSMEEDGNIFPKSSVVTTKTDAKGVTESEVIVGQDDSKTTTSLFRPSKIFGNWFDPANYGFKSDDEDSDEKVAGFYYQNAEAGYPDSTFIPSAFDGTEESAIEAYELEQAAKDGRNFFKSLINSGNTDSTEVTGLEGNLQNKNTDAALEAYYADNPAVGSGMPALTGEELAESIFKQGANASDTHVMPDGTVMAGATHGEDMEGDSSQTNSLFSDSRLFGDWFDPANYNLVDKLNLGGKLNLDIDRLDRTNDEIRSDNAKIKADNEMQVTDSQSVFDNENELVETSKGIENEDFEVVEGVTKTDIDTLASNPDATEMLWEFEDDLEAADGDEVATEVALQDISEGISLFEDDNPQLAKSIYAMIAAMLMGQSFGDAMATGFGVMEEAAMKEDADTKTKNAELVGMLMENPEYMDSEDFLDSLRELGISEKDLPYYQKVYQAKKLKTNSTSASAWVAKQITAKDKIKSDLISDENTGHIDEFQRMIAHIEAKQDPNDPNTWFDFSDASQNWAIYEAQTNFERAKKKAIEDGDDSMVLEPVIYYENLFGLIDGNGDNSIVVSESSENQILQAMAKNSLRNVYGNSDAAEKAEMKISAAWYSEPLNKGKSNDEYLMHLAIEANELENEYLLGRQ